MEVLAHKWRRRKEFDGVRTAMLRLHHCILMAEIPLAPSKKLPSIQQTFSRGQATRFLLPHAVMQQMRVAVQASAY